VTQTEAPASVVTVLQRLRCVLGLLAALLLWIPGTVVLYLCVLPAAWVRPEKRPWLVSCFMKGLVAGILVSLKAGGASFRRLGRLPTEEPTLIVMNHQSLVDILTITLMAFPYVPAFVTRRRYARLVPLVSPCIRLLGCPIVDPKRDTHSAVEVLREAALALRHGLLIFPEGHRSRNGEIQQFKTAGLSAILGARPMRVFLVVSDGVWTNRRFVDFVLNVHRIQGDAEVLGPFQGPSDESKVPEFITKMRARMVAHLGAMRRRQRVDTDPTLGPSCRIGARMPERPPSRGSFAPMGGGQHGRM